jgi:hypothetical protein
MKFHGLSPENKAACAALFFFRYAEIAAKHGGFWCSWNKRTKNAIAKTMAKELGLSVREVCKALSAQGRDYFDSLDWYGSFRMAQIRDIERPRDYRFKVEVVALAAAKASAKAAKTTDRDFYQEFECVDTLAPRRGMWAYR